MARLGDICTLNMGQSPDSTSYNEDGDGLPFFQGNADFGIIHPQVRIWCNAPTKIAHADDILISVRAPIGALNIANADCCIGRGLAALTVDDTICVQKYLWHAISSKVDDLNSKGTGSTFKAINKNVLADTEIPLPPLDTQRHIAAVLDKVSDLIALRKQQLAKLDELVKARFVEMFGDPEFNTKKLPMQKLSDLCIVGSSKRIYQNEQSSSGVPFLRVSDLMNRIQSGVKTCDLYIPEAKYQELFSLGLVPSPNDILITSRGTLGKCYIVRKGDRFYFQDGMISWLYDFCDKITPIYLSKLFEMRGFHKQIDELQAGSTVAYLSISMLKKLDVMVPSVEAQWQFAAFIEKIEQSKSTIQQGLDKLETLKSALMQEYFG